LIDTNIIREDYDFERVVEQLREILEGEEEFCY